MEKYGSVIKGLQKNPPARKQSLTFKEGMQALPEAIAGHLSDIRLSTEITGISRKGKGFEIKLKNDQKPVAVTDLVLALPAYATADLIKDLFPSFSQALKNINYPPMVVTHSAFDEFVVKDPVNGFGALHPKAEEKFTSGVLWTSTVFEGRAPKNEILFTTFTGGTQSAANANRDEHFIRNKVISELGKLYNIKGDPKFHKQYKWDKSIPQYDENILPAKQLSDELESENVYVCNSWKNGVSIPDCIEKGRSLAKKFIK
jgi:oxygen-dependent protoporphyrinogen oxidase